MEVREEESLSLDRPAGERSRYAGEIRRTRIEALELELSCCPGFLTFCKQNHHYLASYEK